jgi:ATP-dependent exoDNAse (exonuclease V) alpha subunit
MIQHYAMLQQNLLYTDITRGRKLVVLVDQKAVASRFETSRDGDAGQN